MKGLTIMLKKVYPATKLFHDPAPSPGPNNVLSLSQNKVTLTLSTQPSAPTIGVINNLEPILHDMFVASQESAHFIAPSPLPKKNRLSTSQNRMRFTSPSQPTPPSRLSRSKTRKLANSKKFNPVVLLEKIPVPPQSNSSMTQDSDLFSTPKRPSKLSLSYTRKNLNCKKNPILRAATFLRTYCLPPLEHLQLWGKVHLLLLTVKILS